MGTAMGMGTGSGMRTASGMGMEVATEGGTRTGMAIIKKTSFKKRIS